MEMKIAKGPFDHRWETLKQYRCPDWFRDAKLGFWAHWGPQCVPMQGDWYARHMYMQGQKQYDHHFSTYGHPSKSGYKDIIPLWKAEKFDPDRLMKLYKDAGAKYFVSMGVHHDNFDLWDSKHHKWNAVKMGPKRDILGEWKRAAAKYGMKFGVSEHLGASRAWFQSCHGSDGTGPMAGVPYDGSDPEFQDLYHPVDAAYSHEKKGSWYTGNPEWHAKWFARIMDLVDSYQPDLLYTDGGLPFGDTGRSLVAHFYNSNMERNGGKLEAVYNCKKCDAGEYEDGSCVQDVERGLMPGINPLPWQTDTSIGDWFYNVNYPYQNSSWLVHTLIDIVSKNGNLLINILQRPDGTLDPEAESLLKEFSAWIRINGEGIYGARPWKVFGEGPTQIAGGHFKENFDFTAKDIRFTLKDGRVYAFCLGIPAGEIAISSLGGGLAGKVKDVEILGAKKKPEWKQDATALVVKYTEEAPCRSAICHKITFA